MKKISAEYLYHHTRLPALLSIIEGLGFRYSLLEETIPYSDFPFKQLNHVVCFCDLTLDDAREHRLKYGPVSIALTKEWAIKHSVTPVRYVHAGSQGLGDTYLTLKALFRNPIEFGMTHEQAQLSNIASVRWLCDLHGDGSSMHPRRASKEECEVVQQYALDIHQLVKDSTTPANVVARLSIEALMWYARLLHNELEERDSLMRGHEERSPTGEILKVYNEREWRSVFSVTGDHPSLEEMTEDKGRRLKDEYNLRFEDSDIAEILVSTNKERDDLGAWLRELHHPELLEIIRVVPLDAA
jgi:hypothetical protein